MCGPCIAAFNLARLRADMAKKLDNRMCSQIGGCTGGHVEGRVYLDEIEAGDIEPDRSRSAE